MLFFVTLRIFASNVRFALREENERRRLVISYVPNCFYSFHCGAITKSFDHSFALAIHDVTFGRISSLPRHSLDNQLIDSHSSSLTHASVRA